MNIENIHVYGFQPAITRAMRNPMDSWDQSDSSFFEQNQKGQWWETVYGEARVVECPIIGPSDLELALKLIKRGSEHRKFMRQIILWMDITIPRYVWQELDTYKVSTVRNSCSTMNKLGSEDLTQEDFEDPVPEYLLSNVNSLGAVLRAAKEESEGVREARVQLKNDLPEGFLQRATYTCSYETCLAACLQRAGHRLPQWKKGCEGSIVDFLLSLPYMNEFYEAATFKRRKAREAIKVLKLWRKQIENGCGELIVDIDDVDEVLQLIKHSV